MDKKNTMLLTVIAVATLLVAVVGATFAYFTATNEATGSTTVTTTTETVGALTVTNPTSALRLNLKVADMATDATGNYYATDSSTANYSTTATSYSIAKLGVTGGTAETKYDGQFKINVEKSSDVQEGDAFVTFTLSEGVTITGVTSGTEIDYTDLATSYTVDFDQTGTTAEGGKDLVKVTVKFVNKESAQDHLKDKTLTTKFTNADMSVNVVK